MKCERKCMCGHYDRHHEDIDDGSKFGLWGEGKCSICGCKKFICSCQYKENQDVKR